MNKDVYNTLRIDQEWAWHYGYRLGTNQRRGARFAVCFTTRCFLVHDDIDCMFSHVTVNRCDRYHGNVITVATMPSSRHVASTDKRRIRTTIRSFRIMLGDTDTALCQRISHDDFNRIYLLISRCVMMSVMFCMFSIPKLNFRKQEG